MKPTTPCATHRTIASALGVSAVTVSLALRNHPSIPERTRKRVREEANSQNYRPDPNVVRLMQHLRTRRQKNLTANLAALRLNEGVRRLYEDHVFAGVKRRAEELGFALELFEFEEGARNRARLDRMFRARGVEGLVLLPMTHPRDLSELLPWENYSVVATSLSVLRPRFNTVVPNQFSNMFRLCDRLAELGKTRIGLACTREHDAKVNHRFASAYLWEAQLGPMEPLPPLLFERADGLKAPFVEWVSRQAPEVVVTVSDGFMQSLKKCLPAPLVRRMKWACTGAATDNESIDLGVYENPEEIGLAAVEMLAGMIQRGERGVPDWPRVTEIDGKLIGALAPKPSCRGENREAAGSGE
jgi:DNA-binding LacI/PurR family transcriptional regulator